MTAYLLFTGLSRKINKKERTEMLEAKRLFTNAFAQRVRDAVELNNTAVGDVYYHPSEKKVVKKCIDLSCQKPLHDANNDHPKSSRSEEKWLEAYLIRKAMRNNRELELAGRKYLFLYSQLNFRGKPPRPLDLLLFEAGLHHLVIMELKVNRELGRAKEELDDYSNKLISLKEEFTEVFGLVAISGVRSYIVWPRNERADNNKHDFGSCGVLEYTKIDKPWNKHVELGERLIINFDCVRESQIK